MNLIGLMLAALGAFALSGAVFNWDFFMDSKKGARMSKFMGRNGARVFYGLIGLAILTIGILGMIGVIDMSRG